MRTYRTNNMKTLYTNVQIFNLICVECLEWHIAICFVRYIIFLPLLSAATSSFSRMKNVWQVSVRARIIECDTHSTGASVWVCVCSVYSAYVPHWRRWRCVTECYRAYVFVFNKKVDYTWQKTVSVQWRCARTAIMMEWWAAVLNFRWKLDAIAQRLYSSTLSYREITKSARTLLS